MNVRHILKGKRKVALLAPLLILVPVVGAFAYLMSHGTASQNDNGGAVTTVAPVAVWNLTVAAPTGAALAPGNGVVDSSAITVTNGGTQSQQFNNLADVTVTVLAGAGGDIINATGAEQVVPGCLASWFTAGYSANTTGNEGGLTTPGTTWASVEGGTGQDVATLTMPQNNSVDQSPCEGYAPFVTVTVTT